MPIRIEITGENADHAWSELKGLAAPAFRVWGETLSSAGVSHEADVAEPVADIPAEDARDASVTLADVEPAPKAKRSRKPKEPESAAETLKLTDPAPLISTDPENRVNPADPEVADDPTVPPAEPADDKAYTREDVRDALIGYQNVYGPAAAQSDCPAIMGYAKMSAIPESADAFRDVVQRLKMATEQNLYNRAKV